jgi:thymidylate kinase
MGGLTLRITIFEGCDGGGKTTVATRYAKDTCARYVHLGPFPEIETSHDLALAYIDAMMPALVGIQNIVLDRCWLSEPIYGPVHRGKQRLSMQQLAKLDGIAMSCTALIIHCSATWDQTITSFRNRKGVEMLDSEAKLKEVWEMYHNFSGLTLLPIINYSYELRDYENLFTQIERRRP